MNFQNALSNCATTWDLSKIRGENVDGGEEVPAPFLSFIPASVGPDERTKLFSKKNIHKIS